ncbi:DUF5682 family protein, partial [Streptomyces sp. NPDC052077]|uniref:DUF5682 family protein n=1 Tax=Streptomyces sp. NPDC052077 TaxID=3154757 RepID=UPI0034154802
MLLGVRHHGPGSARAVRAALDAARPAAVLIEGPPEADPLIPLAADPAMRPPVALLAHAVDEPGRSVFWPLAAFSPEWVALRWALDHGVPARFIDLPAAHTLARPVGDGGAGDGGAGGGAEGDAPADGAPGAGGSGGRPAGESVPGPHAVRADPLAALAGAAGHDDPERWWEDVVEHRVGAAGTPEGALAPFTALEEAMTALRETGGADGTGEGSGDGGADGRDLVREAHMRLRLRAARREFPGTVAVVCGAWHVPALRRRTTVAADRALLKGLPRTRVELTWVPWTHRRLSRSGGYGAGIDAPGWYGHLFEAPDRPVERWLTKVAGLLREEDRPVSPAHVIEAVRLAGTLAALRGRPLAGLGETTEAVRAVMCDGSDVPLALVRDRLVVGDVLGGVPEGAPAVPLQRDLDRTRRRLRLAPEARDRELDLDLREDTDAARSRLLHRLRLLGVGWGEPAAARSGTGTFREGWRLRWEPELAVRVAEAGVWGTTVLAAATARAEADAAAARDLSGVTALAERCLLAGLPDALPAVMAALADRAALDTDVGRLARALPALVRALRYGDVRGTGTEALAEVAAGLAARIFVGLPPACTALGADAAEEARRHVDAVHTAVGLLAAVPGRGGLRARWHAVLRTLGARTTVPGVIRGRAVRLLLDDGALAPAEAARPMGLVLSPGTPPADAAAWIEGFVGGAGGGLLLLHDERLLALVDTWLTGVPGEAFTDVLPLLRRTFSAYEPGVRRALGDRVRSGPGGRGTGASPPTVPGFAPAPDPARADAVLPVLHALLGPVPALSADPATGTTAVSGGIPAPTPGLMDLDAPTAADGTAPRRGADERTAAGPPGTGPAGREGTATDPATATAAAAEAVGRPTGAGAAPAARAGSGPAD